MPYITREDGERFVIPSYRDVISTKKKALLKKEVLLLSQAHGEYVALQRKNIEQYEVAFSNEPGYLLGETVWHYFKRPTDLIYCEQIPNTFEAILVIVKGGSVYLDGSFPIDSIPDELVVFRTQQNYFDIYIYGDVPISENPEEGKFTLDHSSVHSFTVLDEPAFPKLPLIRNFQLQLVETVLKAQGLVGIPAKNVLGALAVLVLLWAAYRFFTAEKEVIPQVLTPIVTASPYQSYINALTSPDPSQEIAWVSEWVSRLLTVSGWQPVSVAYNNRTLTALMTSFGTRTNILFTWAAANKAEVAVSPTGFQLVIKNPVPNRLPPHYYYNYTQVIANVTDKLSYVLPGNNMALGKPVLLGKLSQSDLIINFNDISPNTMSLLASMLKDLPMTLTSMNMTLSQQGYFSGTINLKVIGM